MAPVGRNIRANGIRQHILHYAGDGRPLLLLPGITSPAASWGFVAERMAPQYDTYVVDIRGRGLSEADPALDYSLDAMAADAVTLADALDLQRMSVLGHSMGARIALRAAPGLGGRLNSLILADPPVSGPGRRRYPADLSWYLDALKLARAGASAEMLRPFTPAWSEAHLRVRAEWLHTCEEAAVIAAYEGFHTDDIRPDFSALRVPTLLMTAGKGGVILPEDVSEIRALSAHVQVAHVATAGHMIPFDDLEGFFAALDPFLAEARNAGAAP